MAIVAVKATKATTTTGTTATMTGLTATAGNALIAGGSAFNGTTSVTVTRTGDTFTTDTTGAGTSSFNGIASAPNVVAGGADLVVTIPNGNSGVSAFAFEFSGLPTSAISDAASPAIATATSTAAASNALANVTADAVYVALVTDNDGTNPSTVTKGAAWTDTIGAVTATEVDGTTAQVAGLAYQIVASVSSRTATWTVTNSAWGALIAVYKMAAAGAATPAASSGVRVVRQSVNRLASFFRVLIPQGV